MQSCFIRTDIACLSDTSGVRVFCKWLLDSITPYVVARARPEQLPERMFEFFLKKKSLFSSRSIHEHYVHWTVCYDTA